MPSYKNLKASHFHNTKSHTIPTSSITNSVTYLSRKIVVSKYCLIQQIIN